MRIWSARTISAAVAVRLTLLQVCRSLILLCVADEVLRVSLLDDTANNSLGSPSAPRAYESSTRTRNECWPEAMA